MQKFTKIEREMDDGDKLGRSIAAIKTIISYIGENPERTELLKTPERVLKNLSYLFSGYGSKNLNEILRNGVLEEEFLEKQGIISIKNIDFISHCEHHLSPIIGKIDINYVPNKKIAGIGRIFQLVEVCTRRLQIQERITQQLTDVIQNVLEPLGVAVYVKAKHYCMISQGIHTTHSDFYTEKVLGCLKNSKE